MKETLAKNNLSTVETLLAAGWEHGEYWEACRTRDKYQDYEPSFRMTDSKGHKHQINVNFRRQLVTTHRIDLKNQRHIISVDGYIGKFVGGGRGRKKATKIALYERGGLKYIDSIEVHDDEYYRNYAKKGL